MGAFSIREAQALEQRELTRLCVRATIHAGQDEAFIDRVMPVLTITLPQIGSRCVKVAQQESGEIVGVAVVTPTGLVGIACLHALFVEPGQWKCGIGRALVDAAAARARDFSAGALMIYAFPWARGFYERLGAIRIGEGPFAFSPEIIQPRFLYIIPPAIVAGNDEPIRPS
jgi:GNAT superfamily N-acetyltransferase